MPHPNGKNRWWLTLALAALGVALMAGVYQADRRIFFLSYLASYWIFLGVTTGPIFFMMIYQLTGGLWGKATELTMTASVYLLPAMVVFFLPLLPGMPVLYPWLVVDLNTHQHWHSRLWYLDYYDFLLRSFGYFAGMIGLAFLAHALARSRSRWRKAASAFGLVCYVLILTFASIDWFMTLDPDYYSTAYGLVAVTWAGAGGLSLMIVILAATEGSVSEKVIRDLSNLLLAAVMLSAYIHFSQLLIIWSGQLPQKIVFYNARSNFAGRLIGWLMLALGFVLPFVLLLFRNIKGTKRGLVVIVLVVLLGHVLEALWQVGHFKAFAGKGWLLFALTVTGFTLVWWQALQVILTKVGGSGTLEPV